MSHQPQPSDIPDITCPIMLDVMDEPVTASDGFVYEKRAIVELFEREGENAKSPFSREPFAHRNLTPCVETVSVTRVWRKYLADHPELALHGANAAGALQVATYKMPTIDSPLLDRMEDKYAQLGSLGMGDITRQSIVVLGHQGVGKSSLLERLLGFAVFPRHRSRTGEPCTRMAVSVITNRGAWEAPIVRVVSSADAASVSAKPMAIEGWRGTAGLPLDGLPEVVRDIMESVAGGDAFVTDKVLQIRITAPHLPQMVFIDVPGLPGNDVKGAADARTLIVDTINRHKATSEFLWVTDILSHIDNSSVGALIQECGIEAQTTGVLTQVDRLTPFNDDESKADAFVQAVESRKKARQVRAGGGWFAVSNQSLNKRAALMLEAAGGQGSLEHFRLVAMRDAEGDAKAALLRDATPEEAALINACFGDELLREHLVLRSEKFCVERWIPQLRATVFKQLEAGYANLVRVGLPMACAASVVESANRREMAAAAGDARAPSIVQSFAVHEAGVAGRNAEQIVERVVVRINKAVDGLGLSDIPVVADANRVLFGALAELERDTQLDFGRDADAAVSRKMLEFENRLKQAVDAYCGSLSAGFRAASASTARTLLEIARALDADSDADRQRMEVGELEGEVKSADAPFALRRFSALQASLAASLADEIAKLKPTFDEAVAATRAVMAPQQFEAVPNEGNMRLVIRPESAKTLSIDHYVSKFVRSNFMVRLMDAVDEATGSLGVAAGRDPRLLREDAEATRVEHVTEIARLFKVLRVLDEAVV